MSVKNRPEQAFGSVFLCTGSGVRLIVAVGGHDVAEDLAVGRRRPRDGVGACFDGLEDALIRRAGANAITWTPPTNGEIFRDIMAAYRDNKPHP